MKSTFDLYRYYCAVTKMDVTFIPSIKLRI